jgi:hypothetical protein
VFCDGSEPNPFPGRFSSTPTDLLGSATLLRRYIALASGDFDLFFRPWFWLMALLTTTGAALWHKNFAASLIALSGLCYLAAYFLFLPAPDFRYAYWAIFAQVLSSFLLLIPVANTEAH